MLIERVYFLAGRIWQLMGKMLVGFFLFLYIMCGQLPRKFPSFFFFFPSSLSESFFLSVNESYALKTPQKTCMIHSAPV